MRPRRNGESGITLIEMLVSLALFSLVLGAFGAIFLTLAKTNATITRAETAENVKVVRRFLLSSLEASRAQWREFTNGQRVLAFSGEAARVQFTELSAGAHETGGLYQTDIWRDAEGRLMLQRRPLGWGRGLSIAPEVLLKGVEDLALSYLPCPSVHDGAELRHWTKTDQLPFAIRISLRFAPGDQRRWLPLTAFIPAATCPLPG